MQGNGRSVLRGREAGRAAWEAARLSHGGCDQNWRVRTEHGEVIAIEPGEVFEHVFTDNDDDFDTALQFAADQLRKAQA